MGRADPQKLPGISVPRLVELLRQMPDVCRSFSTTTGGARQNFGITAELCHEFVTAGLPHVRTGADFLFDANDLESLSLNLLLPSPRLMVMKCWARTMRRVIKEPASYRVEMHVRCPAPGHSGSCGYDVLTEDGRTIRESAEHASTVAVLHTRLRPRTLRPTPEIKNLLREFENLTYVRMAKDVATDTTLVTDGRISECNLAARALVQEAGRRNLVARLSFGLIVATPFSSPHTWAELLMGDEWLPVDPLLGSALRAWGLDGDNGWPDEAWPASLFHRLGDRGPLVRHGALLCPTSLPTKVTV